MWKKIKRGLLDPIWLAYRWRAKIDPNGLFRRYASLARRAGFNKLYLVLSFDCDTPDDIKVVGGLHDRLAAMGVNPVYAVAGELLQEGEKVYRRIKEAGGEFINHGYQTHTYFDAARGEYASCFFYEQLSQEEIREDLRRADTCLRDVLGLTPQGCRVPHFGTFQKREQLIFLHSVLRELGYQFSSSTVPYYAFRYGPIFKEFGEQEIPVSGMASAPLTIVDSWNCFMAPNRKLTPADYYAEGVAAAAIYHKLGVGLLNYYVDPLHVYNQELFFQTLDSWLAVAQSVNYRGLLEEL